MFDRCYRCGESGHTRSRCPQNKKHPAAAQASPAAEPDRYRPQVCLTCGLPHNGPCEHERADYETAGATARQILGFSSDPFVRTEFRRQMRLPLRTEAQLRSMALEQVEEHRAFLERAEISEPSASAAPRQDQKSATTPPQPAP